MRLRRFGFDARGRRPAWARSAAGPRGPQPAAVAAAAGTGPRRRRPRPRRHPAGLGQDGHGPDGRRRAMGGGAGLRPRRIRAAGGVCGIGGGTSQIAFLGVEGGEVAWDVSGQGMFDSAPLVMPGRQNFSQGAIYRLKLTNIPDRPGVELYPDARSRPGHAADRRVPRALADSGAVHRRGPRPGAQRQLRDQGDLPAGSRVPGTGPGRRRDAGQHAARSGRRSDRRGRPPRRHPGDPPHRQPRPADARPDDRHERRRRAGSVRRSDIGPMDGEPIRRPDHRPRRRRRLPSTSAQRGCMPGGAWLPAGRRLRAMGGPQGMPTSGFAPQSRRRT